MLNGLDCERRNLRTCYWLMGLCCLGALCTGLSLGAPAVTWAQEEKEEKADAKAAKEEAAPEEGTEGDAAATKDDKAAAKGTEEEPKQEESFLLWLHNASGPFGYCIMLESFILVALIVVNSMSLRREIFVPSAFVESFEQKLQTKDYQGAYELSKKDESFLARILAAGLGRLSRGYDEAVEAMQEVGEEENMSLDHKLSYIGMIGTTAPMFGLLGTVQGMIAAFDVIATSTTSPKPSELARGIQMALVTTLEGLVVAIPAVIAFGIFRNKLARIVLEVGMVSEGLMSRFAAVGKRPAAAAGSAPAPAAPANPEK